MSERKGERIVISNSDHGYGFIERHCTHCARDVPMNSGKNIDDCEEHELCPILAKSFSGSGCDEWRTDDQTDWCEGFVPMGEKIPTATPEELETAGQERLF